MPVHRILSMSWPDFERLSRDRLVAVLPLGAIEAHGPHLPLATDIIIAEAMARDGAARLSNRGMTVVVLPAIPFAPAPFAAAFAGTVNTPPSATTSFVTGITRSLAQHGVGVTAIANAHHDPAHVTSIRAAVTEINAEGTCKLAFPDLTRRRWASRLTQEFQSGACHAGRYEGSVVLAAAPELIKHDRLRELPPNPHSLVEAIKRGNRTFAEAGGPQAYFGWPAEATAAEGHRILESLGTILEESVLEVWEENRMTDNAARSDLTIVNPVSRERPRGFSHGIVAPAGWRTLSVAGQTAADAGGVVRSAAFVSQFATALERVLEVVRSAGGQPEHVVRMTVYVTDLDAYRANRAALGEVWKRHMQSHYPAMALVGVSGLVDRNATVEIEADAVLPPSGAA